MLTRRSFLAATAAASTLACSDASETAEAPQTAPAAEDLWGGPVLDIHMHFRGDPDANAVHLDGSGVSHAVLLARASSIPQVKETLAKHPNRYVWSASVDVTLPDAADQLRAAVNEGAIAFGELKKDVMADGPELQRLYALAAELDVPILIHFQEFPHYEGETNYATGIKEFAAMLEKYPKTKFVGHADAFWANVSADYQNQEAYPSGPIVRGGVTDKLLADYPNLYGDLSANSGNNALSRDAELTADFLARHQDKLLFGSDCACEDGKGKGRSQANNPAAARLFEKCVARETLAILKRSTSPEVFRKLTWENARRVYKIA